MNSDGRGDRSAGPGSPWASLLDPVANARALGDVQAQGLRAAGELVERLVRSVDGERRPVGPSDADPTGGEGATGPSETSRLVEVWIELLRRTADSVGRLTDRSGPGVAEPGTVEIDVTTGIASGGVRMVVDPRGAVVHGTAEVWLHNGTTTSAGPLALHCGELRTAEGVALVGAVTFDPGELGELPARSSRGIALSVTSDEDLSPGTYRGLVQAAGAPDVWLPFELVVEDPRP